MIIELFSNVSVFRSKKHKEDNEILPNVKKFDKMMKKENLIINFYGKFNEELPDVVLGATIQNTLDNSPNLNIEFEENYEKIECYKLSNDWKYLAILFNDVCKIMDVKTQECIHNFMHEVFNGDEIECHGIYNIEWSSDGNKIMTGGIQYVKIWDIKTGNNIFTLEETYLCDLLFANNGYFAIYSYELREDFHDNERIRIWDSDFNEHLTVKIDKPLQKMRFSNDSSSIFAINGNVIDKINVKNGKVEKLISIEKSKSLINVEISPNGDFFAFQLLVESYDVIDIYSTEKNKFVASISAIYETILFLSWAKDDSRSIIFNTKSRYGTLLISEWNDRIHYLFPEEFKRLVFQLMLVKRRREMILERNPDKHEIPMLSMQLWLNIFQILSLLTN